mgnify:CR=1 FL=1
MAELENNILAVVEPAIMPTKIEIDSVKEEGGDAPKQSKSFGTMVPFILVNNYQFRPADVVSFKLDLSGILPSCTISLYDTNAKFAVTEYPRDGDYFTILINSKNQETFKSVHMDFDIISVTSSDSGGKSVLNLVGMSKIPKWMSEDCKNLEKHEVKAVAISANDPINYPEDSFENMIEFAKKHQFISEIILVKKSV